MTGSFNILIPIKSAILPFWWRAKIPFWWRAKQFFYSLWKGTQVFPHITQEDLDIHNESFHKPGLYDQGKTTDQPSSQQNSYLQFLISVALEVLFLPRGSQSTLFWGPKQNNVKWRVSQTMFFILDPHSEMSWAIFRGLGGWTFIWGRYWARDDCIKAS